MLAGSRGQLEWVQGNHTSRWSTTRRAGAVHPACGARPPVAVTTQEACGESSRRVLEANGRHCRGATTRRNATSIACAGSAPTSVHRDPAANATSPPTLPPVVSMPGSVQESLPEPEPAELLFAQARASGCCELTHRTASPIARAPSGAWMLSGQRSPWNDSSARPSIDGDPVLQRQTDRTCQRHVPTDHTTRCRPLCLGGASA